MHFIIFTGGEFKSSKLSNLAIKSADWIIAADSGANTAVLQNIIPSAVIGDFDSIDKKTENFLKDKKSKFIRFPKEKDKTDTHLAVDYAIKNGADKISILGGFGNRLDHSITNLFLATKSKIQIYLINNDQIIWIEKGPKKVNLMGKPNDLLSLIPLTPKVNNIKTEGLYYPLKNEDLLYGESRGVNNLFIKDKVQLSFTKGLLLFVHTHS